MKEPSSDELSLRERALIDEARELVSPSALDAARVKGKLWAALPPGETASTASEHLIPKSSGLALKQGVGLLAVGLGVGLAAGYGLGRQENATPVPASVVSAPGVQPTREDEGQTVAVVASATEAPATPIVEAASADDAQPPRPSNTGTQRVAAPSASGTSDAPMDEVAWVQRVQRALAKREPQLALGLLRRLDEALPNGRLLEERRAADVIAHCQISQEQGRARAAAFSQRFARSVHLARIQAACGLDSQDDELP